MIVSPILTNQDAAILDSCSANEREELVHRALMDGLDLENEFERSHVTALGYLLKNGALEIKIDLQTNEEGKALDYETAAIENRIGEKVGIFQDQEGNAISFRGTINERLQIWERGIFAVTVDASWIDGQRQHVLNDTKRFDRKWDDIHMLKFPNKTRVELIKNTPAKSELNLEEFNVPRWARHRRGNTLWPHQIRAVNLWINSDFHGIFSIATAGGKTLAALVAASIIPVESIVIILVPTKVLVTQWEVEIKKFDPNADLIICDSDHQSWNKILPGRLGSYVGNDNIQRDRHLLVLATMKTAISQKFMNNFEHISPKFITIIADEVHHLGATKYSKIFNVNAQRRLGLSATFQRDRDEIGTEKIMKYFGNVIEETYTIGVGIREGRLSSYDYFPFFAYLSESEFFEYEGYTVQIGKIYAQLKSASNQGKRLMLEKRLERLLIGRAEIIKKAEDKIRAYGEILRKCPKKPYVVFTDDYEQLEKIKEAHRDTIKKLNMENPDSIEKDDIMVFSGRSNDLERQKILNEARHHQTPIFAMYCLDEGVDMPEFQSAILVSSSASKRQYIQRRGRILRTNRRGNKAHLYDIVVLPDPLTTDIGTDVAKKLVAKELKRVNELASEATNKWSVYGAINKKLEELGHKGIYLNSYTLNTDFAL